MQLTWLILKTNSITLNLCLKKWKLWHFITQFINIFQTLIFMFSYKNETVPLVLQNIFTIKPRNKYTIKVTNILIEVLCWRKFSEFKISFCRPIYYYYHYYYYCYYYYYYYYYYYWLFKLKKNSNYYTKNR